MNFPSQRASYVELWSVLCCYPRVGDAFGRRDARPNTPWRPCDVTVLFLRKIQENNGCLTWVRNRTKDLTHWGRVNHICVGKTTIIGSDNGLSPGRRQAIIWTNVGILLIGTLGTNFSEMLIECHSFSFKIMHMKMSSGKWPPSCLGLNVLNLSLLCCVQYRVISSRDKSQIYRIRAHFLYVSRSKLRLCSANHRPGY